MALKSDEYYMKIAVKVAYLGLGYTSPNPAVGAVVVDPKTGEIVAKGYHRAYGLPHAEVEALEKAKERAKGAYLYVTLEPCCHQGKTPPCTEAIIKAGIKRVVCGIKDPNPIACGGLGILQSHGVEVKSGVCAEEVAYLTRFHLSRVLRKRPWVMMKVASTLDGRIATSTGESKWITDEPARKFAHKLRAIADAILVGKNTVLKDNPELTVRMVKGKNPIRLILDTKLSLSPDYKVFEVDETKQTIIFCGEEAPKDKERIFIERGVEVIRLPCGEDGEVQLRALLSFCQERGITSILVEGGGKVHGSFLKEELYDEVFFMYGPLILGDPLGIPSIQAKPLKGLEEAVRIFQIKIKRYGGSVLIHGLTKSGLELIQRAVKLTLEPLSF